MFHNNYNIYTMEIITVTNQKGGVGKTTTSMNLAAGLGLNGKKVLLIDLDPQANSTSGLGLEKHEIKTDVFSLLVEDKSLKEAIYKTTTKNVDIIPSTIQLAGADIHLSMSENKSERIFEKYFVELKGQYDYIIMDCPPSLGLINRNALASAHRIIIPIQAEYYALEGLTQLLSTISLVKKMYNPNLTIGGILLTMYDARINLANEVKDEIMKFFKGQVFKTMIPRNVKLAEAPSTGQAIFEYDKNCEGAKAYEKLTKEVLKWGDK